MNLTRFLRNSAVRIHSDGFRGVSFAASRVGLKGLEFLDRFTATGDPIYEEEWDLLIVLDGCRYDLMEAVVGDYGFLPSLDSRRSVNSVTRMWMRENFTEEYRDKIAETHYITGNPFSQSMLDERMFSEITEVWQHDWTDPGTVPPQALTDAAIRAGRESDASKIIAHYMQPHCPFIPTPEICNMKDVDNFGEQSDVWEKLQRGKVCREDVLDGYEQNLRLALENIDLLLENVDADKVVITSDHGNAVGEWGLYGHLPNIPLDCMRKVPWIETKARDNRTYYPSMETDEVEITREDQLRSLGYL